MKSMEALYFDKWLELMESAFCDLSHKEQHLLVNRHCMIGHDPVNSLEKICYCGWRGIGLLAHSRHEADERVKEIAAALARVRLEEATNWHRFDKAHDDNSWCCQREKELRDEVMALEY